MKRLYGIILVLVLVNTIIISGCSPVNNQPTFGGVAATSSGTSTNDSKMEALVREKLQEHHSIDPILFANKSREEWNKTLDRMISYGAKISTDEKNQIIDWLMTRNN